MAFNRTFPGSYITFEDYTLGIFDSLLELLRDDDAIRNYQFRAVELVGHDFIPDDKALPSIRIVPDPDTIRQNETNTRDHNLRISILVFDRKVNRGESSYREHVTIAGRVYDLLVNNLSLDGLVQHMEVDQVATRFEFTNEAGGGMNLVSIIRVVIFDTKEEGQS